MPGIGVALVARVLAHAIGDHAPGLGGGRHHRAAGAHAEAVDRAAIAGVMHQLVVRGAEFRMTGESSEARAVDQRLRMFDPKPNREGLWPRGTRRAARACAACRASCGPSASTTCRLRKRFAALEHHALDLAVLDQQIGDLAFEAHFAAERDDLRAHLLDDAGETERADVRLADEQNFLRRTGAHELVHHLAAVEFRILDLAVELAVGEQARPTLAELHVGFGRQDILAPQRPGVLRAPPHVTAALEHDGLESHLRQQQRGKQSAGTETDDDRPLRQVPPAPSPPGDRWCRERRRSGDRCAKRLSTAASSVTVTSTMQMKRIRCFSCARRSCA